MKKTITLHIEVLPEGWLLATSKDVPGLVVQEATIDEVIATARDAIKSFAEMDEEFERKSKMQKAKSRKKPIAFEMVPNSPMDISVQVAAVA